MYIAIPSSSAGIPSATTVQMTEAVACDQGPGEPSFFASGCLDRKPRSAMSSRFFRILFEKIMEKLVLDLVEVMANDWFMAVANLAVLVVQ